GIVPADRGEPIGRHHPAMLTIVPAAPVEAIPGEVDAEAGAGCIERADSLRHHLVTDAVPGDDGDPVARHWRLPAGWKGGDATRWYDRAKALARSRRDSRKGQVIRAFLASSCGYAPYAGNNRRSRWICHTVA